MPDEPNITITKEKLILRDFLAADRTDLANERTLLAYARTAFTFILAGATIIKFFDTLLMVIFAGISMTCGIAILLWGIYRYHEVQKHIKHARGEEMVASTTTSISIMNLHSIKQYLFSKIKFSRRI